MSADNLIAVVKFKDGDYRVAHTFRTYLEEIHMDEFFPTKEDKRKALESVFKNSSATKERAKNRAYKLAKKYSVLEYGICYFDYSHLFNEEKRKMSNNVQNKFWIVVNDIPTTVTYKHASYAEAEKEAERLARKHHGETFIIMESQAGFVINDLVSISFVHPENNPDDPNYIPF